jgi:hypothetical protein
MPEDDFDPKLHGDIGRLRSMPEIMARAIAGYSGNPQFGVILTRFSKIMSLQSV